jgi:hypothetical protein
MWSIKSGKAAAGMLALACLFVISTVSIANAQLGTSNSKYASKAHVLSHGPQNGVNPFITYQAAEYATGGVGLRNQNQGSIAISGLPAGSTSQDAYLYWAFLLDTNSPPPAVTSMQIIRSFPVGPSAGVATVSGTLVGVGSDPCWGSAGAYIYRAQVPTSVATGNGNYLIRLMPGAGGLTDGEDPWDGNVVFQLAEGASLVIVSATGSHTVSLYDSGIAGLTSIGSDVSYTLNLPIATSGNSVLWDNFGADGQIGASRVGDPALSGETTMINNAPVAGPGINAPDNSGDWNGSSGFPLPQLWDDTGHDITNAAPAGTSELNVYFTVPLGLEGGDCWNVVGNVVSQ